MRRSARPRGVTVVELTVAAAIAAVVLVGIATAMASGVTAWRTSEELLKATARGTAMLRMLRAQLDRALASETFHFEGTETQVHFVATGAEGPMQVSWGPAAPSGGSPVVVGTSRPLDVGSEEPPPSAIHRVEYPWVERLAFAFPFAQEEEGYLWQPSWAGENATAVPQAVRVTVRLKSARGAIVDLDEVIVLPQGTIGTIEQGAP